MNERKIGFDRAVLGDKILEDTDEYLTMPAVIARELVQDYPDGKAYKPADELEKASWTAEGRWVAVIEHPKTGLITRRQDIKGRIENVSFAKDIIDPKTKRPMVRGIRAVIKWFKDKVSPELIEDIKTQKLKDVSIGFTYEEDRTEGEWDGQHYDFVQRNIFIDHVVAPCPIGRCPSPYCGIGVDTILETKVEGDPWEETEEHIRSGHKEPSEVCRTKVLSESEGVKAIVCKYGDKWEVQSYLFVKSKGWNKEKAQLWYNEHKGDTIDFTNMDACPICNEIEKIGVEEASKRLAIVYGQDVLLVLKDENKPPETKPPEVKPPEPPKPPEIIPPVIPEPTTDEILAKIDETLALWKKMKQKNAIF